jgi:hypothetical protein
MTVALIGSLWVPLYARSTPKLGDFPFFYWYQLVWVPTVGVLLDLLSAGASQAGLWLAARPG